MSVCVCVGVCVGVAMCRQCQSLLAAVRPPQADTKRKLVTGKTLTKGRGLHRRHGQYQPSQHGGWGSERREVFSGPGNIYEVYTDSDKLKNDVAVQQPIV